MYGGTSYSKNATCPLSFLQENNIRSVQVVVSIPFDLKGLICLRCCRITEQHHFGGETPNNYDIYVSGFMKSSAVLVPNPLSTLALERVSAIPT